MQTNCIFIAFNFVIHLQILIFLVVKIARIPHTDYKFSNSLLFYLFTFAINLWHRKFVTAVLVNNQHGIPRGKQNLKTHKYTQHLHSYTCRGTKIHVLTMKFVCIFFRIC